MATYLFHSTSAAQVRALTVDENGANLPTDLGPWQKMGSGLAIRAQRQADPVEAALRRDGFLLMVDAIGHHNEEELQALYHELPHLPRRMH